MNIRHFPRVLTSTVLGLFFASASAVPTKQLPAAPETSPVDIPQIVIEAPEPRFVAPTSHDRIGRIWVPVLINGEGPFRMVLDTGASGSAVIARVSEQLGIGALSSPVRLLGVTGPAVVPVIGVDRLEFGDLSVGPSRLPIVADVFGGAEGVLGNNGFGDMRISIGFADDSIYISRSRKQRPAKGFTRIPLELKNGLLPTFSTNVGDVRTRVIINTGAEQTVGNLALREALMRRSKSEEETVNIIGVTLEVAEGKSITAPPINFGGLRITGLNVTFSDLFIFDRWNLKTKPALLLGMDFLGSLDTLIIDYKMKELQVQPRALSR